MGVRPNTIYRHEAGVFKPTEPVLKMLAQIYGKPVEWFYGVDAETTSRIADGQTYRSTDSRGIDPVLEPITLFNVNILGAISAGGLVEAWQEDLGTIGIPAEWLREAPRAFALKVTGNSLLADGISEGDTVIVDPGAAFVDGKIYAVRSEAHNQTVTARHVFIMSSRYKLVSGDGEIDEVEVSRAEILGRIRWSMREH